MKTDVERLIEAVCESIQTDDCIAYCNYGPCSKVKIIASQLISKGVTIPVRCGECKHSIKGIFNPLKLWCNKRTEDVHETDFCSYGERKEE